MKRKVLIGMALLLVVPLLASCGGVAQDEYDDAVAAKDTAEAQVAALQSQLDAANAEVASLRSDLLDTESEWVETSFEVTAAQSVQAAKEDDLKAAEKEVAALEAEITRLEAIIAGEEVEEVPELSFEAVKYTNADYGFSLYHPDTWEEKTEDLAEGTVWRAGPSASYYCPSVKLIVWDEADGATLEEVYAVILEAWSKSMTSFEASDVTINDTAFSKGVVVCSSAYGDYDSIIVGFIKDGQWIIIEVSDLPALGGVWPSDTMPEEILSTVTFE